MDSDQRAEDLDDDKLGGDYPPEQPLGVDEYGTTHAEEEVDEPLEERVAREEPDRPAGDDPEVVLVAPDEGQGADDEPQAVGRAVPHPDGDDPGAPADTADTAAELGGEVSAEEAAVHLEDEGGGA